MNEKFSKESWGNAANINKMHLLTYLLSDNKKISLPFV